MGYFTDLFCDCAVLKIVNGTNAEDEPIIIAQDEINCKIEFKNSLTMGSQGQQLTTSGKFFTESVVKVGDIVTINEKDFKVVNVNPYYPLDSKILAVNEVYFA